MNSKTLSYLTATLVIVAGILLAIRTVPIFFENQIATSPGSSRGTIGRGVEDGRLRGTLLVEAETRFVAVGPGDLEITCYFIKVWSPVWSKGSKFVVKMTRQKGRFFGRVCCSSIRALRKK